MKLLITLGSVLVLMFSQLTYAKGTHHHHLRSLAKKDKQIQTSQAKEDSLIQQKGTTTPAKNETKS